MDRKLFEDNNDFDTEYLNDAYSDDAETAASVFEQYLNDLPANLSLIRNSFRERNIELFRQVIHKQKPGFSYVGLTDVTGKLQELQASCNTTDDMGKYQSEIEQVIERIDSSATHIHQMLTRLQTL